MHANRTSQDIDDVLKKAQNQLRATAGINDTNIFWLVPALDSPSLRVPKNTSGGTSAPANPSFHSPWIGNSVVDLAKALRMDIPRLGAFVRPMTFIVADSRTASDGSLQWCQILKSAEGESLDFVRVSPRAAALNLARHARWGNVREGWLATKARDGDVLDNVTAPQ